MLPSAKTVLSLPDPRPVCRLIAGAGILIRVNKTLNQPRPVAVTVLKIIRPRGQTHAQNLGAKIVAVDTRAQQKTAHAARQIRSDSGLRIVLRHYGVHKLLLFIGILGTPADASA